VPLVRALIHIRRRTKMTAPPIAEKNAMCRCSDTTGIRRNVILAFDPIEMDLSPGDDKLRVGRQRPTAIGYLLRPSHRLHDGERDLRWERDAGAGADESAGQGYKSGNFTFSQPQTLPGPSDLLLGVRGLEARVRTECPGEHLHRHDSGCARGMELPVRMVVLGDD